jgi:predicted transcriptional regulator
MNQNQKRMGRPLKAAQPGKRVSLGLKVTPEIKARLDEAARANGRTQSQEAEYRLERSFERQDLLPEILSLASGERRRSYHLSFEEGSWTLKDDQGTITKTFSNPMMHLRHTTGKKTFGKEQNQPLSSRKVLRSRSKS